MGWSGLTESSLLMTFNTLWGKYRWPQLPFGLSDSSDIFQQRLDAIIKTVPRVTGIADDVLPKEMMKQTMM